MEAKARQAGLGAEEAEAEARGRFVSPESSSRREVRERGSRAGQSRVGGRGAGQGVGGGAALRQPARGEEGDLQETFVQERG